MPDATPPRIIDAHHHLWDLSGRMQHTWLAERGVTRFFGDPSPIQRDYHTPDFRADIGELPVTGSVFVQCGVAEDDAVAETRYAQEQADEHGLVRAIVAFCDLTADGFESVLDAHRQSPALRGIRQIVGRDAAEDARNGTNALLDDPRFLDGLRTLAARGLSFDLQLTPPLLTPALKRFSRVEDLTVAICHAGSPQDLSRDGLRRWQRDLAEFARRPNTICKLSGFGMFDHDWTLASLRERVLRAIDAFGPARCAFGSNFPVDRLYRSYADTMGAYLTLTDGFTRTERAAMFADVAEEFYRI